MGLFDRFRRPSVPIASPADGTYFVAQGNLAARIYGRVEYTMGPGRIFARCYSTMCPEGERGSFPVERIIRTLSEAEFEAARRNGW